jgi:glutamate---cysteine ligase / carboxylate-amine ligase
MAQASDKALRSHGAQLLPGGVHPWMNPATDSKLWPYEDSPIYAAYDRIFNCQGHGWFNLQSVHLNLPFNGDAEFAALHSAIALLLPLLPALSNSSPVIDGQKNAWMSSRLAQYAGNQRKITSIAGQLIPEPVGSEEEYRETVLAPMYRDIAPSDPEGILQDEWLNSRAAIARFDRNAIEIRCMDAQETPRADVALCWVAASVLKSWIESLGGPALLDMHRQIPLAQLRALFEETARMGRHAKLPSAYPWKRLGWEASDFPGGAPLTVGDLWRGMLKQVTRQPSLAGQDDFESVLSTWLTQGALAERILAATPQPFPTGRGWSETYRRLSDCLVQDKLFMPAAL